MKSICFNFQVHQPFRLKRYRFFQIGKDYFYYDEFENEYKLNRVAKICYLKMNSLLLELIKKYYPNFKVSFSISGTALEQFELYNKEVIDSFRKLAETGCVEFLTETYYHSLSSLYSEQEFIEQVNKHADRINELFGYKPITFRNTEMIYSDKIGELVDKMGYDTILTEGAKHILGWKSPNLLYCSQFNPKLNLLLRNFRLSDDIAFRFSNQAWCEWPLTAEKYFGWLENSEQKDELFNIFMDYEALGEHQTEESGIFNFFSALVQKVNDAKSWRFITPSQANEFHRPVSPVSVTYPISWADEERDLTAWLGNDMQMDAYEKICSLEQQVKATGKQELIDVWRHLQTSDHFYYMSTKWFSDGSVHKSFNPYSSPYDAYINYMNILNDLTLRVQNNSASSNKQEKQSQKNTDMKKSESKPTSIATNQTSKKSQINITESVKSQSKSTSKPLAEEKPVRKPTRKKPEVRSFDDIVKVADNELKTHLRSLEPETVFAAIQNADENIKDKILSNITKRLLLQYESLSEKTTAGFTEKMIQAAKNSILKPFKK